MTTPDRTNELLESIVKLFEDEGVAIGNHDLAATLAHGLAEYEQTGSFVEWTPTDEFYEQPH